MHIRPIVAIVLTAIGVFAIATAVEFRRARPVSVEPPAPATSATAPTGRDPGVVRTLREVQKLQQKISSVEPSAALDTIVADLTRYRSALETCDPTACDLVLHGYADENFLDRILTIQRTARLSATLANLDQLVNRLEKDAAIRGTDRVPIVALRSEITGLRARADAGGDPALLADVRSLRSSLKAKLKLVQSSLQAKGTSGRKPLQELKRKEPEIRQKLADLPHEGEPSPPPAPTVPIALPVSPGTGAPIRIATCTVQWSDGPSAIADAAQLAAAMEEVRRYYAEVSYGAVNVVTVVAASGIIDGAHPEGRFAELDAAVEVCDDGIDFRTVDVVVVHPSAENQAWGVPHRPITTDEGDFDVGGVWISAFDVAPSVITHEVGHAAFGLPHASGLECAAAVTSGSGCSIAGYMNPFDVMGRHAFLGHLNAEFKRRQGWLTAQEVTASGSYQVAALERSSDLPQVLRIPYGDRGGLCVEYRKPIGYDDFAQRPVGGSISSLLAIPSDGCVFLNVCRSQGSTLLIDTTPGSQSLPPSDFADTCIRAGQQFTNTLLGLSLSFTPDLDVARVVMEIAGERSLPDAGAAQEKGTPTPEVRPKSGDRTKASRVKK